MKDNNLENFKKNVTTNHHNYCIAKGDTGASSHYFMAKNKNILKDITQVKGPSVLLPNKEIISSNEQGLLPLSPLLSKKAQQTMILPELKSSNLISIGQLCDDGCDIIIDKDQLVVSKNNNIILKGHRNTRDGLWDIPIQKANITTNCCLKPPTHSGLYQNRSPKSNKINTITSSKQRRVNIPTHLNNLGTLAEDNYFNNIIEEQQMLNEQASNTVQKANVIIRKKQTHADLVTYLHACCFSPVKSTFRTAIKKGFLKTWPELTTQLVDKHLDASPATIKGHMTQEKSNLQSTKARVIKNKHPIEDLCDRTKNMSINNTKNHIISPIDNDFHPSSDIPNKKTNEVICAVIDRTDMSVGFIDQCGRFPQRSSRGNEYIIVAYHYDGNAILATATKDRTAQSLTNAWQEIHDQLEASGNKPDIYILDNEKSNEIIEAFNRNNVKYQLCPPYSHRSNLAERAIQTFKSHFKSGLATCDPNFPLCEWDRLLPQAILTLNLLRASRTNPRISAYTYIFGEYDFRSTPLAPPGTRVITHIKAQKRNTWDLHGAEGYYVGPALNHYRCVTCYIPKTKAERVCDTVFFLSKTIPIPKTNTTEYLHQAASDIIHILSQPPSPTIPSLRAGDPIRGALYELATLLQQSGPIEPQPNTKSTDTNDSLPRVALPDNSSLEDKVHVPPRVTVKKKTPTEHIGRQHVSVSALDPTNTLPRNRRYNNQRAHRYPLRSLDQCNHVSLPDDNTSALSLFHIFDQTGRKLSMDSLLKGKDKHIWERSLSNEWGRLAAGSKYGIIGTKTIRFIHKKDVPTGRDITYATFVCDHRPRKKETHRVRITVGGDRLTCLEDTGSPAANMVETKCLVNSTISEAKYNARFMSADVTNYFLATPMGRREYMRVPIRYFPTDIIELYNLRDLLAKDGCIYIEILKGMYGLKNAAILAYTNLKKNLGAFGYTPIEGTVGLWRHKVRRTKFCVCVDDFGVKYFSNNDLEHLLNALKTHYKITTDYTGTHYCGMTLNWNYDQSFVDVSMPGYVTKAITRLNHVPGKIPQFSPHAHVPFQYLAKGAQQLTPTHDSSPLLSPKDRRHIQSIVGSLLYYGRCIDYTILPALNDIAREQAKPTERTLEKAKRVLDYVATYPEAYIRYHASDMVLRIDSDAAYLVAPQAKSRIAGFYRLSNNGVTNKKSTPNGGILVECKTLRHVVASAAEAEVAGVFHNAQIAISLRHILRSLGHTQPATPIKTDNSTVYGFIHNNIHQKKSKSWDMRYWWLRDRQTQHQLKFFWEKGENNFADYFTKHHPAKYHKMIRHQYVQDKIPKSSPEKIPSNKKSTSAINLNFMSHYNY